MRRRFGFVSLCLAVGFVFLTNTRAADKKWTELNIGPFYVDTDGDIAAARNHLTQLEQVRWVLGGLLESKDLPSVWPIRVLLTRDTKTNPNGFVLQQGRWLLVCSPDAHMPLEQVARILLDDNTPRLPAQVEKGLPELLSTLEARGARVSWGGAPAHPDLAWARMQLFATKFEYALSFHIFLAALKTGTDMRAAERNAFGKDPDLLEKEVGANLAAGNWQPVQVSGRPLDPKRDFGEHSLDDASAQVYIANANFEDTDAAEKVYKAAVAAGGLAAALGYQGLCVLAETRDQNSKPFCEAARKAGNRSASVYMPDVLDESAIPMLKKAQQLNPLWAIPVHDEALVTAELTEKLVLLKKATQLDPRMTQWWIELAKLQNSLGQAGAAQSSWAHAEDSATNEKVRQQVHQQHTDSEQERLDGVENAAKRERDATREADERAQQAETERIRAAETRANQGNEQAPQEVVPWNAVVPTKHLSGKLVNIECIGNNARLEIKDQQGASIRLLLKDASASGLVCGPQRANRAISLTYAAQPDDRFQTAGMVTAFKLQ